MTFTEYMIREAIRRSSDDHTTDPLNETVFEDVKTRIIESSWQPFNSIEEMDATFNRLSDPEQITDDDIIDFTDSHYSDLFKDRDFNLYLLMSSDLNADLPNSPRIERLKDRGSVKISNVIDSFSWADGPLDYEKIQREITVNINYNHFQEMLSDYRSRYMLSEESKKKILSLREMFEPEKEEEQDDT